MTETWRWLESTRKLQAEAFGVDYESLTGDRLADYVLMNAYALIDELAEAMKEFQWKPWSKNRGAVNRDKMAGELVDLAHFLGNMANAIGMTDDEWERIYREKQGRNQARQDRGYDSWANRCPGCQRELDKPGAVEAGRCTTCGSDITHNS